MNSKKKADVGSRQKFVFPTVIVFTIFLISIIPFLLTVIVNVRPGEGSKLKFFETLYADFSSWYDLKVEPVQELRVKAKFPNEWEGRYVDVDQNYSKFEKWFSDNVALRDFMIRSKNELDYRIFKSSSRVYYGEGHDIYGRPIVDLGLPATERLMDTKDKIDAIHSDIVKYVEKLKAQGVTTLFVAPMQKQYFYPGRTPFFAPKLPLDSNFMSLYRELKSDPKINFIDVYGILSSMKDRYQIFYTQDFHWTGISGFAISRDIVNRISSLEGVAPRWTYPLNVTYKPFVGADSRFSARLNTRDSVSEPELVKSWDAVHALKLFDPTATGYEFETDELSEKNLLPSACLFGNSFSDAMVASGLPDYFQKFTRVYRSVPISEVPKMVEGRCKYLVFQILDIDTLYWKNFK